MATNVNARLDRAIRKRYGSVVNLCRREPECSGMMEKIEALVNLEESPLNGDGEFTYLAQTLSECLDILTDRLFTLSLYAEVLTVCIEVTVVRVPRRVRKDLRQIADSCDPANEVDQHLLRESIERLLNTLSYRDREIIRLRYGLGDGYEYTLKEVGNIFRVTRERIRAIEAQAIHKLQQPQRAAELVGFVD